MLVFRKLQCQRTSDFLLAASHLQDSIDKSEGLLRRVGAKLILGGSVGEGTKVGEANEFDFTLSLTKLTSEHLQVEDDASKIIVVGDGCRILKGCLSEEGDNTFLNFPKFMEMFLECLHKCILAISDIVEKDSGRR